MTHSMDHTDIVLQAGDVIFIDLGVYGFSQIPNWPGPDKTLRKFEKFTLEHQGFHRDTSIPAECDRKYNNPLRNAR